MWRSVLGRGGMEVRETHRGGEVSNRVCVCVCRRAEAPYYCILLFNSVIAFFALPAFPSGPGALPLSSRRGCVPSPAAPGTAEAHLVCSILD